MFPSAYIYAHMSIPVFRIHHHTGPTLVFEGRNRSLIKSEAHGLARLLARLRESASLHSPEPRFPDVGIAKSCFYVDARNTNSSLCTFRIGTLLN